MIDLLRRIGGTPPATLRVLALIILSIILMFIDHRTQQLERLRDVVQTLIYPVMFVSTIPVELVGGISSSLQQRSGLQDDNELLRQENLLLRSRLKKLYSLEADNRRLKRLLGQAEKIAEQALLAELVEVSLEPYTQKIMLNKGSAHSVYVGQPVINGDGVVGQVVHTGQLQSTVTLLTDPSSAIPVMVMRNGLRGVLYGTGVRNRLSLPYLTPDADIRTGDLLISSGMGGRFPTGYPVATVTAIRQDPSEEFLSIDTLPVSQLDHGREVLLIWPAVTKTEELPAIDESEVELEQVIE
jgi:rod shape-determining protein MreC